MVESFSKTVRFSPHGLKDIRQMRFLGGCVGRKIDVHIFSKIRGRSRTCESVCYIWQPL